MADQQVVTATDTTEVESTKKPANDRKAILIPALLVILGLLVMIYPVVSTQWNNHQQQVAAKEYDKLEKEIPQDKKDEAWERAHEYNKNDGTGPILDPWLARISPDNAEYAAYLDQLNLTESMGRLVVPSAQADLPIYHGTDDKTLQNGIGHLYGSDLPVGGLGTHSVLTGHTGLPNATLFDNLNKVKEGDAFYIQVAGHKLKYVVDQIKVVLPNETDELKAVEGKDYVTLITCTPYGINTHRLLVRGHQVPLDPEEAKVLDDGVGMVWQWWMYALIAVAVAVLLGFLWWLRNAIKAAKTKAAATEDEDDNEEDLPAGGANTEWESDKDDREEPLKKHLLDNGETNLHDSLDDNGSNGGSQRWEDWR